MRNVFLHIHALRILKKGLGIINARYKCPVRSGMPEEEDLLLVVNTNISSLASVAETQILTAAKSVYMHFAWNAFEYLYLTTVSS